MAWMLSLKVVLISIAVLCAASGLKVSIPLVMDFLATHIPVMWSFCLLCFKPPYIYIIIHGIIIIIPASSRFHRHSVAVNHQMESTPLPKAPAYGMKSPPDFHSELIISETPIMYEPREETPIMQKCDTWEHDRRDVGVGSLEAKAVKKSETFKERMNGAQSTVATSSAVSGGELREEESLSEEEVNRRVEEFIRTFNEEVRLLGEEESLNQ